MTAAKTIKSPRRSIQLLVWLFAAVAVLGVGIMSGTGGSASEPAAMSMQHVASQPITMATAGSGAPESITSAAAAEGSNPASGTTQCEAGGTSSSSLPAMRWQDFGLSLWDNGFIVKFDGIMSSAASLLFWIGGLIWQVLFLFIDFGVTFQPLCNTAGSINTIVASLGSFAAWFSIPILIFWAVKNRRSIARMRFGRVIGSLLATATFLGSIFYFTQKANSVEGQDDLTILTTRGTVPWVANSLMNGAASAYTSINEMNQLFTNSGGSSDGGGSMPSAFYDRNTDNELNCYAFTQGLYDDYEASLQVQQKNSPQVTTMTQLSSIWEQAFLSSWITAQFGPGSADGNFFPAQTACRHLEATVDVSDKEKADTFKNATGLEGDLSSGGNGLIHMMQPLGDLYRLPVDMNWASCQLVDNQWQLSPGADGADSPKPLLCSGDQDGMPMSGAFNDEMDKSYDDLIKHLSKDDTILYLSGGEESIQNHIGNEPSNDADAAAFQNYRKFASASVGGNIGTRIGQGLMSAVIAGIYLWSFGPVALGLVLVGFAMIIFLSIFPLTLMLLALGVRSGKTIMGLTLSSTMALFIFGTLLSILSFIITLTNNVVTGIVGEGGGFASQILLAATPVIAVLLLKKILQTAGFGNITSLAGSLGMASAIATRAAGGRGDGGVSGAANRGLNAAKRGMGATARAARNPSALQNKVQNAMGKSALGRKALSGMQSAASKARAAKDAAGAIAKDRAQSAGEEFGQSKLGKRLANAKNGVSSALDSNPIGAGLKKAGKGLAKSKTARYGAALAAAGAATGALGPAGIPAILAASGAAPLARAATKKGSEKLAGMRGDPDLLTRDKDGNLVLKDDDGNPLAGARQLAYARANGLMQKADVANSRIAARALQGMTPEEKAVYSADFDQNQIAGMPLSQSHKSAQKAALEARKYVSKIADPDERNAALEAYAGANLDAARARQNGALSSGGMHPGFSGYDNEVARQMGLTQVASKMGVNPSDIILGNHGIAVPAPTLSDNRLPNNAPKLSESAALELAGHPALYLDRETRKRQVSESDEQYSARISATLSARGLMDDSGQAIDVFAANGIDVKSSSGAQRVQKWLDGGRDDVLGSIEFTKVKGEDQYLRAASAWTNKNTVDHAERQWDYMVSALHTRDMALTDTRDIASIPVAVDASKAAAGVAIPNVFGSANPVDAVSGDNVVARPRVQFNATPLAAGGGSGSADVPVQQVNMAPEAVKQVTLGDTITSMTHRTAKMSDVMSRIHDKESPEPIEDRMRHAARALEQVDGLEKEVKQALEGMRASSYARAALAVDHWAATSPEQATHGELRSRSQSALKRAQSEASERENILSRKLSDLFKSTRVAQNSSDVEERRKAFRAASQSMSDIEETMRSLYEEESQAAKEMSEAAEAAFTNLRDTLETDMSSYKGPNRRVVTSTSVVEDMARRRKESFSH